MSPMRDTATQGLTQKCCVRCDVAFEQMPVPCADGKPGCCVLHYGARCPQCRGHVYEVFGLVPKEGLPVAEGLQIGAG